MEEGLFQIAREALNNTIKHANASKILLSVQKGSDKVSMEISDDGIGFDPKTAHQEGRLGLVSMKERAQSHGWVLLIESSPGNGTKITVEAKLS